VSEPTPSPALRRLDVLVGEWRVEPPAQGPPVEGRVWFEWLPGRRFLVQRWEVKPPEYPSGIAIIGEDAESGELAQHYFDSRGVARVYGMSLDDDGWRLWRAGSDFAQRFSGTFAAGGDRIDGRWEIAWDGSTWEHDFDLGYLRTGGRGA